MRSDVRDAIEFENGNRAAVVRVPRETPASHIIAGLHLSSPRAVLILNGGTAELDDEVATQLGLALRDGVARFAAEEQTLVLTGATDAGIFHLFGEGIARYGRRAPCIGVAVESLVRWAGKQNGIAPLEPHHSHFVLVEGDDWGDETDIMYALAEALSRDVPSVAVFAGGGNICIEEMQKNVAQGRVMVLLAGSGRATDAVIAAARGRTADDRRIAAIAEQGRIRVVDIAAGDAAVHAALRDTLFE